MGVSSLRYAAVAGGPMRILRGAQFMHRRITALVHRMTAFHPRKGWLMLIGKISSERFCRQFVGPLGAGHHGYNSTC
jgi:hypothetical protein